MQNKVQHVSAQLLICSFKVTQEVSNDLSVCEFNAFSVLICNLGLA